jgi:probable phosphoglycerate mutase
MAAGGRQPLLRVNLALPKVFLARHATPDWTRTDLRYDVPPGPPLTPAGEAEAARLGEYLRGEGVVRIAYSPMERARRTALIAADVAVVPAYEELGFGEWRRDEPESAVLERVRPVFEALVAASRQEGPVAVVSHGGPIFFLLRSLQVAQAELDHYRNQFDHRNPLPPAGAWSVTRDALDAAWHVRLAFAPREVQMYVPVVTYV